MLESLRAGAAKLCIMSRTVGHHAGSSKNLIRNFVILSPIPCPQFPGQNLVLKFGPRTRIYTERSAFRDQNLVPKSRPEVCKKMRRRRFQVLAEFAPHFWEEMETCQPQRREKTVTGFFVLLAWAFTLRAADAFARGRWYLLLRPLIWITFVYCFCSAECFLGRVLSNFSHVEEASQ